MITYKLLSPLRRLQILLGLAAIANLFLPWVAYSIPTMDNDMEKRFMSGWSLNYGTLMVAFVVGSFLISLLESLFGRRAAVCHIGFFCVTLLMASIVHFLQFIPGGGLSELSWGFRLFLVIAVSFFASSAMLSPQSDALPKA
jgi:hypothetical protein